MGKDIAVIIYTTKGRRLRFHFTKELPAIKFLKTIDKKYSEKIRSLNVTLNAAPPPIPDGRSRGKLWCPYCRKYRKFVVWRKSPITNLPAYGAFGCRICGISTADYYVSVYNHLFSNPIDKKRRRRRKK